MPLQLIPLPEANSMAEQAAQHEAMKADGVTADLTRLGLYRWTPPPWSSSVPDTSLPYFFWVYTFRIFTHDPGLEEIYRKRPGGWTTNRLHLLVGPWGKSEDSVVLTGEGDRAPVVAEMYGLESDGFPPEEEPPPMQGLRRATPRDLKKLGLSDIEILSLLSA